MRWYRLIVVVALAACEATMPPPPANVPVPPPSGKEQLDDSDIERGLEPVREFIGLCQEWYRVRGTRPEAIIEIEPSGRVARVSVERILNLSQRRCIERDLALARFPAFSGPAMRVVREFSYSGLPAPSPSSATPPSSGKARLDDDDLRRGLRGQYRAFEECAEKHRAKVEGSAKLTISPSGTVTSVETSGISGEMRGCIQRALFGVRYPSFSGPAMVTNFDLVAVIQ